MGLQTGGEGGGRANQVLHLQKGRGVLAMLKGGGQKCSLGGVYYIILTFNSITGALDGGPNVACQFYRIAISHVLVAYFPQCPMSNLRKGYVTCHFDF